MGQTSQNMDILPIRVIIQTPFPSKQLSGTIPSKPKPTVSCVFQEYSELKICFLIQSVKS